jgi:triosephosphate isomerase
MASEGPRPLVAGNWKMNGGVAMLKEPRLLAAMLKDVKLKADVMVCPPAIIVRRVKSVLKGSKIRVGGQDCHWAPSGAHTGDISAEMLKEGGCSAVITGHSERRTNHGETDELVQKNAKAAQRAGLTAIICVGETLEERKAGQTLDVVTRQLRGSVPEGSTAANTVIAYEPVWAIGTGKTASKEQAQEVHAFIRGEVAAFDAKIANLLPILYGGSVKASNAAELFAQPDVDGGLVGGASLVAQEFSAIVAAAADTN